MLDKKLKIEIYITLAHLQLELELNKLKDKVRSVFGQNLDVDGKPLAEKYPVFFWFDQMLGSGEKITKGMQGQKLLVETEKFPEAFSRFTELYLKFKEELETNPKPGADLPIHQRAAITAAQIVAYEYLGFANENTPFKNSTIYRSNIPSLADFKGKQSAVCT